MNILNAPLKELSWFEEAAFDVEEGKAKLSITGTVDSEKLHMISALGERTDVSVIITYSDVNAAAIAEENRFFDRNTYVYPAKDLIFYQADINGAEILRKRLSVIKQLLTGDHVTVVTTFDALMEPCLPLEVIKDHILYVEKGRIIEEDAAAIMLVSMGYTRTSYQVASPGEFSIRGGIIDVFDVTAENPLRIELWGDEVVMAL